MKTSRFKELMHRFLFSVILLYILNPDFYVFGQTWHQDIQMENEFQTQMETARITNNPNYKSGYLAIRCNANVRYKWHSSDPGDPWSYENVLFLHSIGPPPEHGTYTWDANTLNVTWNYDFENSTGATSNHTGSMTIIVNDSFDKILSFTGSETTTGQEHEGHQLGSYFSVTAANIPVTNQNWFYYLFRLIGEDLGDYITSITYRTVTTIEERHLVSYSFSDDSHIDIGLERGIKVVRIEGEVELLRSGQEDNPVELWGGEVIRQSDRIYTGLEAICVLQFPDNSIVTIRELTDVKVSAFLNDANSVRTRLWLKAGEIAAEVDRSESVRSDFAVKTPTATCSVRGTSFTVDYDESEVETDVAVVSGFVDVVHGINSDTGSMSKVTLQDSTRLNAWQSITSTQAGLGPVSNITLQNIRILPEQATLSSGDSLFFIAEGFDTQGNRMGVSGDWSATGGTIDETGKYVAGQNTGTFSVDLTEPSHGLTATAQITIGEGGQTNNIPIKPVVNTEPSIEDEFWVDVVVGEAANPVTDLLGVSFKLNFTQTGFLDVVTPHAANVIPDGLLGSDVVFIQTVDETNGSVAIGVTRKDGAGGVDGSGTVARVKFVSRSTTPENTQIQFSVSDIQAIDDAGNAIELLPENRTVTLSSGLQVWPGDTDNDGDVDQADILPIGLHWNRSGPARPNASMAWTGQSASAWTTANAVYADADGNGTVDQADVLPIGFNWERVHATSSSLIVSHPNTEKNTGQANIFIELDSTPLPGEDVWAQIHVTGAEKLFGIAFKMSYTPADMITLQSAEPGQWMGDDIVQYVDVDRENGLLRMGLSRKHGQGGLSGSDTVVKFKIKVADNALNETSFEISLSNVILRDNVGNPITLNSGDEITQSFPIGKMSEGTPRSFHLGQNYPNPFNPVTSIQYDLPTAGHILLKVFDTRGREISVLVNTHKQAGRYSVNFTADQLPSGVYFYSLTTKDFKAVKKMLILE